jgi:hypothetical protein
LTPYLVLQALLLVDLAFLGLVAELEGLELVLDRGHLLLHLQDREGGREGRKGKR